MLTAADWRQKEQQARALADEIQAGDTIPSDRLAELGIMWPEYPTGGSLRVGLIQTALRARAEEFRALAHLTLPSNPGNW